jgi:hypothetical protein
MYAFQHGVLVIHICNTDSCGHQLLVLVAHAHKKGPDLTSFRTTHIKEDLLKVVLCVYTLCHVLIVDPVLAHQGTGA